jgi:hypothetical protein
VADTLEVMVAQGVSAELGEGSAPPTKASDSAISCVLAFLPEPVRAE